MARRDHPDERGQRGQGDTRGRRDVSRPRYRSYRVNNPRDVIHSPGDAFTCGFCHALVGPLPSGGHNRNHCPHCLYSRHVDAERSGDRASPCKGMMEPVGLFERPNGEEVIVHRCVKCGFERFNRVGADDDEARVAGLPRVAPRSARRAEPDGPSET